MQCRNGNYCNGITDDDEWDCCKNRGGRQKCPKNYPFMCAKENCTVDDTDYCCETRATCKSLYGGIRTCNGKEKSNSSTFLNLKM